MSRKWYDVRVGNIYSTPVILPQQNTQDPLVSRERHSCGVVDNREQDEGMDDAAHVSLRLLLCLEGFGGSRLAPLVHSSDVLCVLCAVGP